MHKKGKANIIEKIKELLHNNKVETQEDIREALQKKGTIVNQAMISRILHQLGAIKMVEGERTIYRLPVEYAAVNPNNSLKALILKIVHNESLVVIQTTPGSAQLIARLLDQKEELEILGTVAGDDTILVAPKTIKNIKKVFQHIYNHLLG